MRRINISRLPPAGDLLGQVDTLLVFLQFLGRIHARCPRVLSSHIPSSRLEFLHHARKGRGGRAVAIGGSLRLLLEDGIKAAHRV